MSGAAAAPSDPPSAEPRRRQRGVALIIVLWTLLLLSVLAGAFSGASRTHAKLAFNVVQRTKAEALADAAVFRAIAGLLVAPENGGLRVDQTPYEWVFGDGRVLFTITDEGAKIDLNAATPQLLADVFTAYGEPSAESTRLANAIFDFRNDGRQGQPTDAEAAGDERSGGMPAGLKRAPFERVDELGLIAGMPADLLARITPLLTVYSGTPEPAITLLAPEDQERLRSVLSQHPSSFFAAGAGAAGSGQSMFNQLGSKGLAEQPGAAAQRTSSSAADTNALRSLRPEGTDERSGVNIYTVHAEAHTAEGGVFVREAVVEVEPDSVQPFRFLDIRQGTPRLAVDR